MSKYLHYCHICGTMLDDADICQLTYRNNTEAKGKGKKLFDVCKPCMCRVEDMKFKMPLIKTKKPIALFLLGKKWKENGSFKSKSMYHLLPEQFDEVCSLEVPPEDIVIKTKFNKRHWTKASMAKALQNDDKFLLKAMYRLYQYQTEQEQSERRTISGNAVGFNKPDANFLSGMSRMYMANDGDVTVFSERQIDLIRRKMLKYTEQLTMMYNFN